MVNKMLSLRSEMTENVWRIEYITMTVNGTAISDGTQEVMGCTRHTLVRSAGQ